ncbi:ABC transporter permease subunit [Polaromonas sp.]|jgi:putrescine transport system permease protein|uniref:ABC transporter permease n=1 Tax=Polaromonas sp. TaxID=1869339 RepID=UPI002BD251C5|nr:ABC transporter permease subunit [Polaromonas sp.]HQS32300.1 ABC transporter permease subunit [Polaromonas sp.]HQS90918.1 ABC transporter permease subunit [Polaromonas sp.]
MKSLQRFAEAQVARVWLLLVYVFLYLPLLFLIVFSFNSTRQDGIFTGFSLRWYDALWADSRLVDGFLLSLKVALVSATFSVVLGSFAAFVLVRYLRFRGRTLFYGLVNAPLVMPEVIIGMSLLLLMVFVQRMVGWPDRGIITIVAGHTLLGMAYATVVIQSRLSEVDRSIEEAAMDLGCGPMQVFFLVTLPTIAPALVSAWLLSFTLSFDDVVISEFLSGPGVTTLPQVIFGYARRGVNPSIYAAATLLIAVVSLGIVLYSISMLRRQRRLDRDIRELARPVP